MNNDYDQRKELEAAAFLIAMALLGFVCVGVAVLRFL
jgi:hypothetical protein